MCHLSPFSINAMGRPFDQPPLGVTTFTTNCPEISKRMLSCPTELQSLKFKSFWAMNNAEIAVAALLARKSDGSLSGRKEPRPPAGRLPNDPGTRRAEAEPEVRRGGCRHDSGWQCRPQGWRHDTVFLTHLMTLQSYAPPHMNSRGTDDLGHKRESIWNRHRHTDPTSGGAAQGQREAAVPHLQRHPRHECALPE